jgi:hypothetical protein
MSLNDAHGHLGAAQMTAKFYDCSPIRSAFALDYERPRASPNNIVGRIQSVLMLPAMSARVIPR